MEEREIAEVAKVLDDWNSLGDAADNVKDLNDYKTEAIDIIFHCGLSINSDPAKTVMEVINEAFDLTLTKKDCAVVGEKIGRILKSREK